MCGQMSACVSGSYEVAFGGGPLAGAAAVDAPSFERHPVTATATTTGGRRKGGQRNAAMYGATLHSADTDFARFRSLNWVNPIRI